MSPRLVLIACLALCAPVEAQRGRPAQAPPSATNPPAPAAGRQKPGPAAAVPPAAPKVPAPEDPAPEDPAAAKPPPAKSTAEGQTARSWPVLGSAWRRGDPTAMTLSVDGARAYVVEGATLSVLDLSTAEPTELANLTLDATVHALLPVGPRLLIAGGTRGLGVLELKTKKSLPQWIDAVPGRACTAIALSTGGGLIATFASESGSELHLFTKQHLRKLATVDLPLGFAYEVATIGPFVFVALGAAGTARVDLRTLAAPKVDYGPDLRSLPVPDGFELERGFVRDLALLGDRLFLAVDAAGLVEIDLRRKWGQPDSLSARTLDFGGQPSYVQRVEARAARLAVAAGRRPARIEDAAPDGAFGPAVRSRDGGYPLGAAETLWLFKVPERGDLDLEACEALPESSWRDLALRGKRVFALHGELGWVVRALVESPAAGEGEAVEERGALELVGQRKPASFPATDGLTSLVDPRVLFFGSVASGSSPQGLLRLSRKGELAPIPGFEAAPPLGRSVGAQWLGLEGGREWFVAATTKTWRLHRATHVPEFKLERWEIVPPAPLDAGEGGVNLEGTLASTGNEELFFGTRSGTSFGLAGYSTRVMMLHAGEKKAGGLLPTEALWQLRTHDAGAASEARTLGATLFSAGGRRLCLVLAGSENDPASPMFRHPRLVVFDVGQGLESEPRRIAVAHGKEPIGEATAAQVLGLGGRRYAFVAAGAAGLLTFDVTSPERMLQVGGAPAAPNALDGWVDEVLDVELVPHPASSRLFAWLACGRRGVARVDVTRPRSFALQTDVVLDTPGYACGLATLQAGDERLLVVGDRRAGLRIYR